jgi:hypothetical protein
MTIATLLFLIDANQSTRLSYRTERIPEKYTSDRDGQPSSGRFAEHKAYSSRLLHCATATVHKAIPLRRFLRKNLPLGRGQVLPKSLPSTDHAGVKPAPTGILFAGNLLMNQRQPTKDREFIKV